MVCRVDDFQALLQYSRREVAGGDYLFLPALNLLYLLGLVEYRPKTDAIEYVGPNETLQTLL
ncbi:MAG: ABC-three component system middle component 8 [Leptolyngbyaceae cyanobacterium]